ncbi:M64 family metallopeptidase [Dokdonella sp.]|uniref:M64 family metallopeptidase n=3 Tax=Dokdonella sp. TaxID=2291710 RepID=UPI002C3943B7|nr:M64 family metallopeptidase [Dokdonella sp.]HPN78656.1 M64 family metallopeptidase [Dokdonella sp.]
MSFSRLLFLSPFLLLASLAATAAQPGTLRVDYMHSGNALQDIYSLDKIVKEPLPWPGNLDQRIDGLNRGAYFFEVVEPTSGAILYSRGFSSIFGEWRTTPEARQQNRSFSESLRFPMPGQAVRIRLYARDDRNEFSMVWTLDVDPADTDVRSAHAPLASPVVAIRSNGDPQDKVDLLILGDGYTEAERTRFIADARRLSDALFAVSPFKDRAGDFNVWALMAAAPQSGVARPSSGMHRWTPLGTRYDAFGSERYVLTFENQALRELAQNAPYEFVEILVNNETYGGGGIYGLYSTAAAKSEWAPYLFVHEFGHHFAGLADEYYTSPVSYETGGTMRREPWEPNVTALHDPARLKWRDRVASDTALPTAWPKEAFETHQREYQKVRADLRARKRPESEMNALFHREQRIEDELFMSSANKTRIGAFEGANYESTGYYRSQLNCVMFTRTSSFCRICSDAIEAVIDQYASPKAHPAK